jgi:hypothetical protein
VQQGATGGGPYPGAITGPPGTPVPGTGGNEYTPGTRVGSSGQNLSGLIAALAPTGQKLGTSRSGAAYY